MAQNSALAFLVLLLLSVASLAWSPASIADRHEVWMAKFGRTYKDDETKQKRMEIFRDNIAFIESFNEAGNDTIELGENEFADLTEEEFKAGFMGFKPLAVANDFLPFRYANVTHIPSIVDWRLKGAVTPVKNQGGGCGSCWAFSSIATVEAIHKIKTGQLISLSEQELVDCDTHDEGCIGGTLYGPYQYILESNGIATESAYPYQWKAQPCNRTKLPPRAVTIKGFEAPPPYDEDAMAKAVANQPISVGMAINGPAFQFYKRGVITQNCGTVLEHTVAIVGYGKSKRGVEFWLAKNQWGGGWGEGGYVRIARNHGVPLEGVCMIAVSAAYPVVD